MHVPLLLACASLATALCPMDELTRRGLAPADMQEKYARGEGLGTPNQKREANPAEDGLTPLGTRDLRPRGALLAEPNQATEDHIRSRLEERDADVDIDGKR